MAGAVRLVVDEGKTIGAVARDLDRALSSLVQPGTGAETQGRNLVDVGSMLRDGAVK